MELYPDSVASLLTNTLEELERGFGLLESSTRSKVTSVFFADVFAVTIRGTEVISPQEIEKVWGI